jgi:hypothetical protein
VEKVSRPTQITRHGPLRYCDVEVVDGRRFFGAAVELVGVRVFILSCAQQHDEEARGQEEEEEEEEGGGGGGVMTGDIVHGRPGGR